MYREAVFFCSTSGHGCVHTYCPYFGKTADCTNASASVHWPWFSKKNLQPQGLQIFFREPWPKYKSFGIVQSLVFSKLGQLLIVQNKFRTIQLYGRKRGEVSYIIQMHHNTQWIDWLKVKKPSVDAKGFGLFAMQDISQHKLITFYLGDLFTTEYEKNSAIGSATYTLM